MSKLPIINTISYSALSNWQLCPRYFELVNVKRLKTWENTPDTIYGKLIHKYVQEVLLKRMTSEQAAAIFLRIWKKFCGIYKLKDYLSFGASGEKSILYFEGYIKRKFGEFEVLGIEWRLESPSGKWPQKFKGFIDVVLKLKDGTILIADLKTPASAFFFEKYKDKYKDYQLTLYKHFYCSSTKTDPDLVETYFFILEKDPESKKPIESIRVTSSDKKVENALTWLNFALAAINRESFIPNRASCFQFGMDRPCEFYKTKNCP